MFWKSEDILVAPDRWVIDPLLQSSLEMRHALRTTPESHLLAEVIPPFPAYCALSAWDSDLESNAVADAEAIDSGANAYDDTRRFMAEG